MTYHLDTWRAAMGLHPWHFWQLAGVTVVPVNGDCNSVTYEYDWQGSDTAGRATIRDAVARATAMLTAYLGYRPFPAFAEAVVPVRNGAAWLPEGHILALGTERLETITDGVGVTPSARDGGNLYDTFTATVAIPSGMTLTADQVVCAFAAGDRDGEPTDARWQIGPVRVTVASGTVTVTGRRWLLVRPALLESATGRALDPLSASSFVSSIALYQRTADTIGATPATAPVVLHYDQDMCGEWASSTAVGSGIITNGLTGQVRVQATGAGCGCERPATRATIRYQAGLPLTAEGVAKPHADMLAWLTAAELKRRICACRETNERLWQLQQDLTLQGTETERFGPPQEDLTNPFGPRRGHVQAWRLARQHVLLRGIAV